MGEGALTADVLLEGSLSKGIDEALIFSVRQNGQVFFAVLRMVLLMVQTQTYRGSSPTVHFPIKYCGYYQSTVERERKERG